AGLCETIVELGRRFGLRTVAEGIETTHESHKLQSIGCQIGQGYLFAKPMPKADLLGRLRARVKGAGMPQAVHGRIALSCVVQEIRVRRVPSCKKFDLLVSRPVFPSG